MNFKLNSVNNNLDIQRVVKNKIVILSCIMLIFSCICFSQTNTSDEGNVLTLSPQLKMFITNKQELIIQQDLDLKASNISVSFNFENELIDLIYQSDIEGEESKFFKLEVDLTREMSRVQDFSGNTLVTYAFWRYEPMKDLEQVHVVSERGHASFISNDDEEWLRLELVVGKFSSITYQMNFSLDEYKSVQAAFNRYYKDNL